MKTQNCSGPLSARRRQANPLPQLAALVVISVRRTVPFLSLQISDTRCGTVLKLNQSKLNLWQFSYYAPLSRLFSAELGAAPVQIWTPTSGPCLISSDTASLST